jgi:hypothetical protein
MSGHLSANDRTRDDDSASKSIDNWPLGLTAREGSLAATSSYEWNDPFHPIPIQNAVNMSQGERYSDEVAFSSERWMNKWLHPIWSTENEVSRKNIDDREQIATRNTSSIDAAESASSYLNPFIDQLHSNNQFLYNSESFLEPRNSIPRGRKRSRSNDYQESQVLQEWNRRSHSVDATQIKRQECHSVLDRQGDVETRHRARQESYIDHCYSGSHSDGQGHKTKKLKIGVASGNIPQSPYFSPQNSEIVRDTTIPFHAPDFPPSVTQQQTQSAQQRWPSNQLPKPEWIWHKPSERIALPPPQPVVVRDGNGERRCNMIFATITMPMETAQYFDAVSLFTAAKNALESAAFTSPDDADVHNSIEDSHNHCQGSNSSSGRTFWPSDSNRKR